MLKYEFFGLWPRADFPSGLRNQKIYLTEWGEGIGGEGREGGMGMRGEGEEIVMDGLGKDQRRKMRCNVLFSWGKFEGCVFFEKENGLNVFEEKELVI